MKLESYAVKCPECKGLRYVGPNLLCRCCNGVGQIIIPDFHEKPGMSPKGLRTFGILCLMVAAAIGLGVWLSR